MRFLARRLTWLALLLLLVPLVAVARPQPVAAAGVVAQCNEGALREAVAKAQLVTFSCSGTIVLSFPIPIYADTVIEGGGSVTLDGGGATLLFYVAPYTHLELHDLTLTGGSTPFGGGGLIINEGMLTISGSSLSGSSATHGGAIENTGTLIIRDSTLSGNSAVFGGAITTHNGGETTITNSTLSGNSAEYGGALHVDDSSTTVVASTLSGNSGYQGGALYNQAGTVAIITSRLTDNVAEVDGGAIANYAGSVDIVASTLHNNHSDDVGGGIYDRDGTLTLTASTLSGNSAYYGAGIYTQDNGTLTIHASTLTDNSATSFGGAIFNGSTVAVIASTLSGNSATQGRAILTGDDAVTTVAASVLSGGSLCSGGATSGGYNVAGDASCGLTGAGDLQNSDPLLGPLQHNGGPTDTQLPQPGSPAIDRVPTSTCATLSAANDGRDQRGALRPAGNTRCDSGATESGAALTAWLVAAFALPATVEEGHAATIYAIGSGPLGANLRYSFGCPTGTIGPQTGAAADCTFPTPGVATVPVTVSTAGSPASSDSIAINVEVLVDAYFCVGERSGALRYLVTPNGCMRGETRLAQARNAFYSYCVGDRSGSMRYLFGANCLRGETKLVLVTGTSFTICVGERSRAVRYVTAAGACLRGEQAYVIPTPVG